MLKMVDGTGIIGVDTICPLGVSTPQPPNYDRVELEGTGMLVLPNSLDAPLERLELLGNSVQGENPAPDNPQEIKSAGRKSKNLFDITKLKKGAGANYPTEIELVGETLIAKKDGGTANQMTFEIELENLEPNTTYEFTTKQTICKRKDSDTEKAGTIFSFKAYKNESQIENKGNVFTTGESESDIYKIVASVIAGDFGSLEYVKFEQPMLSHIKGAAYEPYSDKCLFDVQVTGKNLLNLQKEPDVKGIYQGWKVGNGELLTLGVKDKGNNADIKGCYIGFSNQGSEPNGVVWVVDNGVIKAYPLTQRKAYVSIFPANETAVKKLTERFDIQCELGNVATTYQPYKEQTLTLTSDRPITKWDRLVEQGGEIGWLYGGKIIDSYNSEQIDAEYMSSTGSLTVGATVLYKLKTTEFVPLPQSEQNAIRALKTYYPTTVITVDGGELDPDIKVTYRKEI